MDPYYEKKNAEECFSSSESGWTKYLGSHISDDGHSSSEYGGDDDDDGDNDSKYKKNNGRRGRGTDDAHNNNNKGYYYAIEEEEEDDDSMASDASSGPSHRTINIDPSPHHKKKGSTNKTQEEGKRVEKKFNGSKGKAPLQSIGKRK